MAWEVEMRPRSVIDVMEDRQSKSQYLMRDTYERVRRTLDDALAELELPADRDDGDRSAPHVL
jgi:hypothetical protein